MKDIALHSVASLAFTMIALSGAAGLVAVITVMWLLRELAQRDSGNLFAALESMPAWSLSKHAEWLAPGVAAALAIVVLRAIEGPWTALLNPL